MVTKSKKILDYHTCCPYNVYHRAAHHIKLNEEY
ncbi:hypothetical protein [Salmonella phage SD-1_S14]|nr:hypothetical protein [Salmonella phage SD-2_S15]WPK19356.1 hypothetical protein [Salmonella phage SD-6_S16]WPK20032.1 hypothetical protein [Salmonella phage SD-1_S14]WPK21047.1 hypothetical protein [Salmonella phage SD-15_S21]